MVDTDGANVPLDKYLHKALKITVVKATDLRAADISIFGGGKSDPYVKGCVVDRPYDMFKTSIIKKNLDPVWNETHRLPVCHVGDKLQFTVYDSDLVGSDDSLGYATLEWNEFKKGFNGTLMLEDAGKHQGRASLTVEVEVLDSPLREDPERPRCIVKVWRANNLRAADRGGKSDPYCVYQVAGRKASVSKTKVIKKTLDPKWNETDEMIEFEEDDDLEFTIYHHDEEGKFTNSSDDMLGSVVLSSSMFFPDGLDEEEIPLDNCKNAKSTITVSVDVIVPVQPEAAPVDPGEHVGPEERWPIPYALRSLDSGRVHQLVAYTMVGRSRRQLDPTIDLVLDGPGCNDVSRMHAVIKGWREPDSNIWCLRVYALNEVPDNAVVGYGNGPGGGHAGGGTSIMKPGMPAEEVDREIGSEIECGDQLRFGVSEIWVIERAAIFSKTALGSAAIKQAKINMKADPSSVRSLRIPRVACLHAMKGCKSWFDLISVCLEWIGEPDEPPCVDYIEVLDEVGISVSIHESGTPEEQQDYDISPITDALEVGSSLVLHLNSDPQVLAPTLYFLSEKQKRLENIYGKRNVLD
eukprot:TRINITY_DN63942_c0_g1_i1.p1 TRINITY_DN63942_c0_g1~~TRINITY_DN63942_c0_g1_i1.p1  ORF type:complete len:579 (+),score=124.28 TRINITY_DN63942_c0_g1_i1:142-1878(+)